MTDLLVIVLAIALAGALYAAWRFRTQLTREQIAARSANNTIAEHSRTIDSLRARVAELEAAQQPDNAEHDRLVASLHATIAQQKQALDALRETLIARDDAAAVLQQAVDSYRGRFEQAQAQAAAHEQTLAGTRAELEMRIRHIETLEAQVTALQAELDYKLALTLTLSNTAYEALMVLDKQHRIIAINNAAEELFGRKRPIGEPVEAVTGSPEIDMMVEDALHYAEDLFEEQMTINKRVYRVRAEVIQRSGNTFIGVAFQDVTDLVRLNRARRDMVANISHELRTPIANIRLIIDGLFHEQEKPRRKESASALRAIARETDSLLWLVQELLDLSMIESGQAILRMVETPAADLVDESFERLADQSETKEIKMVRNLPEDIQVLCDRDQARRVLINLIHNAIKWSPVGGTITVNVENADDEVAFSVLDQGPGVPDDYRERIFERFYQVDASRSGGEGTGLGLAICKHIVEAHGGRIWAEGNSTAGGGKFVFTLPRAEELVRDTNTAEFA